MGLLFLTTFAVCAGQDRPAGEWKGFRETIRTLAYSPGGDVLVAGTGSGAVKWWSFSRDGEVAGFPESLDPVNSVAFSPDGRTIAIEGTHRILRRCDADSWEEGLILQGHTEGILAFDSRQKLREPDQEGPSFHGALPRTPDLDKTRYPNVAFSADGAAIASGSYENSVKVWETASGKERFTLLGHAGPVWAVAFSPDGAILASGGTDRSIRLWDLAGGVPAGVMEGHTGDVNALAWTPDGATLVSSGSDGTVRVWDRATRSERSNWKVHEGPVWALALSPDGQTAATGGGDNKVCLFEVATGKRLRTIEGHNRPVWAVTFSPDGAQLATGGGDRIVRIWEVR